MLTRSSRSPFSLVAFLCWGAVVGAALYARPLMPIDETRYVSVAWEMWQRHDFLVPFLNGAPYSHKPPLFFWLMHASWWAFGVNELTPRLIAPLCGLLNLLLVGIIARRLWPEAKGPGLTSPLILMSFLGWALFTTTTMFDMLLTFFVLLGVWGILIVRAGCSHKGWLLLGLSIGGGVLAKGPVTLLYLLPLLLSVPFWSRETFFSQWRWWLLGSILATALGAGIALGWALPAASAGGETYAQAILWSQTAGRVSKAFAHQRPFWWYLPILPLVMFPWTLMWGAWAGLKKQFSDPGSRFCLSWILPQILILSLVSGKQVHYLLPILPAFALLFARSLDLAAERPHPGGKKLVAGLFLLVGCILLALPAFTPRLGLPAFTLEQVPVLLWPALLLIAAGWLMVWIPKNREGLVRNLCALTALLAVVVFLVVFSQIRPYYDFSPMARQIAQLQTQGVSIAHLGKYHDQFHFLGRLEKPLTVVRGLSALKEWGLDNPEGVVVYYRNKRQFPEEQALFSQSYRIENRMGLLRVKELVALIEKKTEPTPKED